MNIAFVISETLCIAPYNGIKIQAQTWGEELKRQGHNVTYVSPWEPQVWGSFDVIHLIGYSEFIEDLDKLCPFNSKIVFSPIIDSKQNLFLYRLMSYWGCSKLRLKSINYSIRRAKPYIRRWYVRSEFEYQYVNRAYGVSPQQITIIPLSYRITPPVQSFTKKNYCLHVSKLTDSRKNVLRLVKAAQKYNFKLVLAGSISSEADFQPIKQVIDSCSNISYLGRVSDEKLISLYQEAKVFALPSINEGVGLVAVEAAACGCDIVVTKIGGPKEYYHDLAYVVDPFSIDDIGKNIMRALESVEYQPKLRDNIIKQYSLDTCIQQLVDSYRSMDFTM
jgi:glycosyltransferase involved in cell wall biosynthesis